MRALNAAGVPIFAGTDAANQETTYGASMHREMELLVGAGLSSGDLGAGGAFDSPTGGGSHRACAPT